MERQSAITELCRRADGVGMINERLDGFDVEHVRERTAAAREYARSGKGPVLLEIMTYRYKGHSMSDPAKYRTKDEENHHKKNLDPILITKNRLLEDFGATEAELQVLEESADAEAQDAYDFAEQSPLPDTNQIYDFVYVD